MPSEVCAVCGMGGYWVGWSAAHEEYRCVNHIEVDPEPHVEGSER